MINKNTYIGKRYVPKHCGVWDNTKNTQYESLSVVLWEGASYTARQDIPQGIDITNVLFWVKSADYNEQITIYEKNVQDYHNFVIDQIQLINDDFTEYKTNTANDINQQINSLSNNLNTSNQNFQNSVNNLISQKPTFSKDNINSLMIAPFFRSDSDTSVDLWATKDGINFNIISDINNPLFSGRDSSIIFINGYFYVIVTYTSLTPQVDFRMYRSKNLKDWETIDIGLGLTNANFTNAWAGEWFLDDNGKLYIILSVQVGTETVNSVVYKSMRPYLIEVIDLDNKVFGIPKKMNLNGEDYNRIDGYIYKNNLTYYLFIKREPQAFLEIWTSSDLNTWVLNTRSVFATGEIEAPTLVKKDGLYYLYFDNCGTTFGARMQVSTSSDLITFSTPKQIAQNTRHGTIYKITDTNAKTILNDFIVNNIFTKIKNDVTTSNITLYVDAVNGNDNNTGLWTNNSLKTIGKAVSLLPKTINHDVIINVASGNYTEPNIFISNKGIGTLTIQGSTNADNTRVLNTSISTQGSDIGIYLIGLNITNIPYQWGGCVTCLRTKFVSIDKCVFDGANANSYGVVANLNSTVWVSNSVMSNKTGGGGIQSNYCSTVFSNTNSGTNNTNGLVSSYGGTIIKNGTQPSGTTAELPLTGGTIR